MNNIALYIFVEGPDDDSFFKRIISPKLQGKYNIISIIKYAHMSHKNIYKFIKSIKAMEADYIFVTDIDNSPCVSEKKENLRDSIGNIINTNRIAVVIKEIESWYLAGISDSHIKKFKIKLPSPTCINNTSNITKEQFNNLFPQKLISSSRKNILIEILNDFSIDTAKKRNESFNYFIEKFVQV